MEKTVFLFLAFTLLTATSVRSDDESLVRFLLENDFVQDSLIEAQQILSGQVSAEEKTSATSSPSSCQRAHAGFHSRPTQEVLARGNAARLLELATLQAFKNFEKVPAASDYHTVKRKRQISEIFRGFRPGKQSQSDFNAERFPQGRNRLQPRFQPSQRFAPPKTSFDQNQNELDIDSSQGFTKAQIDKLLDEALDKLKKDFQNGIAAETVLTLPSVNAFIPGKNKVALSSVLNVLKKTSEETCSREEQQRDEGCNSSSPYRTFSGRCNNLNSNVIRKGVSPSESFGRYNVPFERVLPAVYDDGVQGPKIRSINGGLLPTAREVSNAIHATKPEGTELLDKRYTLALMQWGQYLDHDLTSTAMIHSANGSILDCSDCQGQDPACSPIPIKHGDSFFPSNRIKCIPFTRSLPGQQNFGPREQLNQVTAFIDASSVYGSDLCRSQELRNGSNLMSTDHPLGPNIFKGLLPRKKAGECTSPSGQCFHAGDDRSSEQPGLTSVHTIFQREHNRLAFQMRSIHPDWDQEKVFQEVRKILVAIHQHITFNEFLPRILGPKLMTKFGLNLSELYYDGYDSKCNPNIYNEFASAAFRFGHTLVRPGFTLMTPGRDEKAQIRLRDHFNNPDILMKNVHFIDELASGLVFKPMSQYDGKLTPELTNHLFEDTQKPFSGMDLASINIQRGRDHGLPGFTKYAKLCSKKLNGTSLVIRSFSDLKNILGLKAVQDLTKVYRHVDDIDLFTGGLLELPLEGALVGPTFGCIIARQFQKLRRCDQFWYETPDRRIGFTPEQLRQIKKETVASVLCRNSDVPDLIQKMAFDLQDTKTNPLTKCSQLPSIDMIKWKQTSKTNGGQRRGSSASSEVPPYCDLMGRVFGIGTTARVSACVECSCISPKAGQTQCHSVAVGSCEKLLLEVGPDAIKVDPACHAQCPHLMNP